MTSEASSPPSTATAQGTGGAGQRLWALLVGIDQYAAVPVLRGCVNDVQAMRSFLIDRLGVPAANIRLLTDRQATRANMLQAFQTFLIDNPAIQRGDQILFHYSGHGSQMRDVTGTEPDGLDETIVPQDGRTPGVFDIPDKTLAALLDRLAAQKGDHITVILDSCHSGSGTRRIESPGAARVRRVPADTRVPPAALDAAILGPRATRALQAPSSGPSGWVPQGIPYVLLAGCRDGEESNEYCDAAAASAGASSWHGALTYFTIKALRERLQADTTYASLHEWIAAQVSAIYPTQNPQCEGDRERVVFGGVRLDRAPSITVTHVEGQRVTLSAGFALGLRPGTQLAIYAPEAQIDAHGTEPPPPPIALVEVTQATVTSAQAEVRVGPDAPRPPVAIPLLARAAITRQAYPGAQQVVRLQPEEGPESARAIEQVRQAIAGPSPSPYLQLAGAPGEPADLIVQAAGGRLGIYGAGGELLVAPEDVHEEGVADAMAMRHALEAIARYRAVLALTNQAANSQLAGAIKLRLRPLVEGPNGPQAGEPPLAATGPGGSITVTYYPNQQERNRYVVEVTSAAPVPVYIHLFTLSPDFSISRLYPALGEQEALRPGGTLLAGLASARERVEFYLPDGWTSSRDYLKAIVTTAPADLGALVQEGLNVPPPSPARGLEAGSPLDQLLQATLFGGTTRHTRPSETAPQEDWAAVELPITTVRALEPVALEGGRTVPLGYGLELAAPPGFEGTATVATWMQMARSAGDARAPNPPPGLERFPQLFQPASVPATRGVGPAALVLSITADEASRQRVTPQRPLRLTLPATAGTDHVADLIPVAFDGEDYLLAGHMGETPGSVEIVWLPPPAVPAIPPAAGAPATRDVGRTLQLFIYQKLGIPTAFTGLRCAQPGESGPTYRTVQREQLQRGQRVALFIHGFNSDTGWMVQGLAPYLQQQVATYDHLLTWDYESLGTSVGETAARLAEALRQEGGFGPDDGLTLDVYAHSMGCLVTRCLVELEGGDQFVDRVVLAGPPNRGSVLALASGGLVFLTTVLLNRHADQPPLGAVNWLTSWLYQQSAGLADLRPDSPLEQRLNALETPARVPYLVLAGTNSLDPAERSRLERLASKVLDSGLDTLFGEQNDIAIGLSSLEQVRLGRYARLTVQELPCDHFSYFAYEPSLDAVQRWVRSPVSSPMPPGPGA